MFFGALKFFTDCLATWKLCSPSQVSFGISRCRDFTGHRDAVTQRDAGRPSHLRKPSNSHIRPLPQRSGEAGEASGCRMLQKSIGLWGCKVDVARGCFLMWYRLYVSIYMYRLLQVILYKHNITLLTLIYIVCCKASQCFHIKSKLVVYIGHGLPWQTILAK